MKIKNIIQIIMIISCINIYAESIIVKGNKHIEDNFIRELLSGIKLDSLKSSNGESELLLSKRRLEQIDLIDLCSIKFDDQTSNINCKISESNLWRLYPTSSGLVLKKNKFLNQNSTAFLRIGLSQEFEIKSWRNPNTLFNIYRDVSENRFEQELSYIDYSLETIDFTIQKAFYSSNNSWIGFAVLATYNNFSDTENILFSKIGDEPENMEYLIKSTFEFDNRNDGKRSTSGCKFTINTHEIVNDIKNYSELEYLRYIQQNEIFYSALRFKLRFAQRNIPHNYWENIDSIKRFHMFFLDKQVFRNYFGVNIEQRFRWINVKKYKAFFENKCFIDIIKASNNLKEINNDFNWSFGLGSRFHLGEPVSGDAILDIAYKDGEYEIYVKLGSVW